MKPKAKRIRREGKQEIKFRLRNGLNPDSWGIYNELDKKSQVESDCRFGVKV